MTTDAAIVLSVDTATLGGSVSIVRNDVLLAQALGSPEVSHSNSLLNDINGCLNHAGLSLTEIDLFAASAGPGSFTGLRIGLATVKALAATLGRPCIGIPTLKAVARAAGQSDATVALLPAGRGEVFVQMFSVASSGDVEAFDAAAHLSPGKMLDKYGSLKNLRWCGEGAHKYKNLLQEYANRVGIEFGEESREAGSGWSLAVDEKNLSQHVAALALQQLSRGAAIDAQSLTAIYVRPSDAELKCP